jgi:phytoene synthase
MRFQIDRNRQLYSEATPGIAWLDPAGRFAIAAAAGLYRDILETIAARDGDVFSQRARPRTRTALPRAVGLWWRSQRRPVPQRTAALSNSGARASDLGAIERG